MSNNEIQIPFYIRASIFFIGLIALLAILYLAQGIIIPLIFSLIIAILLNPLVKLLEKYKIKRVFAIFISLVLSLLVIVTIGALLVSQFAQFSDSWPLLVEKFTELLNQSISWVSEYFNIQPYNIHEWIVNTKEELINISGAAIGQTLVAAGNLVVVVLIIPVYTFLILFYQPLIVEFISRLFGKAEQSRVREITTQTKTVIQQYLTGLIIETALVALMQIVTLFVLGIEYAILLGIIGALLNLIPYIGGLVAVALPMMIAVATKSTAWYAVYVLITYYIIQLIDNNYIVPKIVASKVKINALFSIIIVIVGNALWGIPGMFLSIPILAIIKLIFDRIDSLKPWGFLLGDTMPHMMKLKLSFKRKNNKLNEIKNEN
jgi:predicted PurR-regulated permease PerM